MGWQKAQLYSNLSNTAPCVITIKIQIAGYSSCHTSRSPRARGKWDILVRQIRIMTQKFNCCCLICAGMTFKPKYLLNKHTKFLRSFELKELWHIVANLATFQKGVLNKLKCLKINSRWLLIPQFYSESKIMGYGRRCVGQTTPDIICGAF